MTAIFLESVVHFSTQAVLRVYVWKTQFLFALRFVYISSHYKWINHLFHLCGCQRSGQARFHSIAFCSKQCPDVTFVLLLHVLPVFRIYLFLLNNQKLYIQLNNWCTSIIRSPLTTMEKWVKSKQGIDEIMRSTYSDARDFQHRERKRRGGQRVMALL